MPLQYCLYQGCEHRSQRLFCPIHTQYNDVRRVPWSAQFFRLLDIITLEKIAYLYPPCDDIYLYRRRLGYNEGPARTLDVSGELAINEDYQLSSQPLQRARRVYCAGHYQVIVDLDQQVHFRYKKGSYVFTREFSGFRALSARIVMGPVIIIHTDEMKLLRLVPNESLTLTELFPDRQVSDVVTYYSLRNILYITKEGVLYDRDQLLPIPAPVSQITEGVYDHSVQLTLTNGSIITYYFTPDPHLNNFHIIM